jgi:glycosyltransferase involved in cell wall biosynthesis
VAVVLKGYPRLSESFIAAEILGLERAGLPLLLVSLRHPTEKAVHDLHRAIAAPVLYLPEYLHHEPRRVLRALTKVRRLAGSGTTLRLWLRDLVREPTRNRVRRLGQAAVLAAELPAEVRWLYGHFLHTPGSVTRYAATLLGLPFSLSAHAKDIWTTPDWEKREKLLAARWTVTCTQLGFDDLHRLAPEADIALVHHGLDLQRFPTPLRPLGPDGRDRKRPVQILAVARAVPKKGLDVLLKALALLPRGLHWRFVHIGGGVEIEALRARAARLGLSDRVDWQGAQPHDVVLAAYRRADLLVLPSRIADDGDRDGLPNVLLEALSQLCAVVATDVAGIPELVEDGVHGRLVPPESPERLADALAALVRDPAHRLELARAGRARVAVEFDAGTGLSKLTARFGLTPASRTDAA